jgi:predicted RNA-binding protein YlxR (DUF448 family)
MRFVKGAAGWQADRSRRKQPGRGAYLCSAACAERARKNKRYPGLGAAAGEYGLIESLCKEVNAMNLRDDRSLR